MRKQQKSILLLVMITAFVATALFLPGLIGAGDLDPSGPPTTGTMHTLDEIYHAVTDGCPECLPSIIEGGVPKTGQTASYAPEDDGIWQKGVAWPIPRFTINDDGTVLDNLTGLIWLRDAGCFGHMTWQIALNTVASFNSDPSSYGCQGYTAIYNDWRLPNIKELQSLIHYGFTDPSLPNTDGTGKWTEGDPFFGVQFARYWSATTNALITSRAWIGDFDIGGVYNYVKTDASYINYVWAVRSGP